MLTPMVIKGIKRDNPPKGQLDQETTRKRITERKMISTLTACGWKTVIFSRHGDEQYIS